MQDLLKIRKQLHKNPELSGNEKKTSLFIVEYLQLLGYKKIHTGISIYSIVAELNGPEAGPTVLFRCELDALPILEQNNFDYQSDMPGISHKCGHDGHMTILLGLAAKLIKEPPRKGNVLLLFQSAEENGQGAWALLQSGFLMQFSIDYVFALHNIPGYPLGNVICKDGIFTPSVESISIELFGKTSHAGEPDKGVNPAQTVAEIINYFNSLHKPNKRQDDYFISTPIQILLGDEAYGTSAGQATVRYTFRTWDNHIFGQIKKQIEARLCEIIGAKPGLKYRFGWLETFKANKNDSDACQIIKAAAKDCLLHFIDKKEPFDWGEDFGLFTEHYKGAMFTLGAGLEHPALHHPDYDFPDELIEKGISMFDSIVHQLNY